MEPARAQLPDATEVHERFLHTVRRHRFLQVLNVALDHLLPLVPDGGGADRPPARAPGGAANSPIAEGREKGVGLKPLKFSL